MRLGQLVLDLGIIPVVSPSRLIDVEYSAEPLRSVTKTQHEDDGHLTVCPSSYSL
jgi:hypothetical protein